MTKAEMEGIAEAIVDVLKKALAVRDERIRVLETLQRVNRLRTLILSTLTASVVFPVH